MPQITVNEIDQSVVTRVVSDDRVKILVPAILSFGPGYDDETSSVMTFDDLSDFNRGCGYTPAEFNPFENDYSRIYARELMKRGAAVSVVRVNNDGNTAEFNIEGSSVGSDRKTPSYGTICKAAMPAISDSDLSDAQIAEVSVVTQSNVKTLTFTDSGTTGNIIPGTVRFTFDSEEYIDDENGTVLSATTSSKVFGTIDYTLGVVTITATVTGTKATSITYKYIPSNSTACWKYTFCPQIQGIYAKYPGSFGNNLFISISQINTNRLAESYQYANISVYYIDRAVNYKYNSETGKSEIVSQTVKSVTMLETKRVSTNPGDPTYFEDVEFDFIRIIGTQTAREELSLIWSNINGAAVTSLQYSGFPVIPLKYISNNGLSVYNFASNFDKTYGTDFKYSPDLVEKLKAGFKGFVSTGTGDDRNWDQNDVNEYVEEVYGDGTTGIYAQILSNITGMYKNFTDPYIYDFDFITSGGFVYEEYKQGYEKVKVNNEALTFTDGSATLAHHPAISGSLTFNAHLTATPATTYELLSKKSETDGTDSIYYKNGQTDVVVASVVLATGVITMASGATITIDDATYIYVSSTSEVREKIYPLTDPAVYNGVTPIHAAMINLVDTRQDCIALFDVPCNYDKMSIVEYSRILNTSYGTMHFPWCWVADPDISGNMLLMAPSYIFLYTFLSNLDNNVDSQKWFPPAGVKRATARVVKKPYFEIGSVILNNWQNDQTARVNPIMKLKQYGYVIYGQYTTLPAIDMFTHSALESLNVRLIANVVKKKIFDVCLNLAFEPNTSVLWLKFYSQMDEYLRYMQYNEGVYAYKIVMDESTVTTDDINHLRCPGKVYIAPTRTAEFFDIDFIITEAGALFNN